MLHYIFFTSLHSTTLLLLTSYLISLTFLFPSLCTTLTTLTSFQNLTMLFSHLPHQSTTNPQPNFFFHFTSHPPHVPPSLLSKYPTWQHFFSSHTQCTILPHHIFFTAQQIQNPYATIFFTSLHFTTSSPPYLLPSSHLPFSC